MYMYSFNALQSVVQRIFVFFNLFFETILQTVFIPRFEVLVEYFFGGVARVLYLLLIAVMGLLDLIQLATGALSGGRKVVYGGQEDYFINVLLFNSGVSRAVWGIVLVAMCIGVLFSMISVLGAITKEQKKGEKALSKAIIRTAKTMIMFLVVPVMAIAAINLSMLVIDKTGEMVAIANGGPPQTRVSNMVFLVATAGAQRNWDPLSRNRAHDFRDEPRYRYITDHQGGRYYWNLARVELDFHITRMQFFPAIAAALFFIYVYLSISLVFAYFLFQLLFLLIVSPFFVAVIPLDDGQMFKKWRDLFLTRTIAGLGLITSVRLYETVVVPLFVSDTFRFMPVVPAVSDIIGPEYFPDLIIKLLFLLLFGTAVKKSHSIVTHIINESAAQEEQKVSEFIKDSSIAVAKKAAELAVTAALVIAAVVAGIFTAGAGSAAVAGAGAAAKGGVVAAKAGVTAAKAGATAAKAGATAAKTGGLLAKAGGKGAFSAGQALAKGGGKQALKEAGKEIGKEVGKQVKDKVVKEGVNQASSTVNKVSGAEEDKNK